MGWLTGADFLSMNGHKVYQCGADRLVWLALAVWLVLPPKTMGAAEEKLDVLRTKTGVYLNVTVMTKTTNYLFIVHSRGMTSLRVEDLLPETQHRLGLAPTNSATGPTNTTSKWATQEVAGISMPRIKALGKQAEQKWRAQPVAKVSAKDLLRSKLIYPLLGVMLLIYLFGCYCNGLICRKAGYPPGVLIWVPVLEWIPRLRAAGMSAWWFLALFVPVFNLVALILWPLRIAKARGKSIWVGVLLLLPITNLFAYLYLAFADGIPGEEDGGPGPKAMSLQIV